MTAVMIGIDPHKASHTAVAIDAAEVVLGELRIRASAAQAGKLVEWAADWPDRTWAVEGAGGLGHVLAQQLVAAGERVLDVQPKLGARGPAAVDRDVEQERRLLADARHARTRPQTGPGGQPGNDSSSSAAGSHPERQLFGQATPGPATTLRQPAQPSRKKTTRTSNRSA